MTTLTTSRVLNNLPMFLAVTLGLLAVWLWGRPVDILPAVLGIIAGGLVDQDHRLTGRLTNVLLTLLAFTISSLAVQWSLNLGSGVFTLVMTALTFGFTLLGAAATRYHTIAFGALAVATYTSLTHQPSEVWWLNPALILAGTLVYSLMALLVYSLFPARGVQESLAAALESLAKYADLKAQFFDPDLTEQLEALQLQLALQNAAVIEAFNTCRRALHNRLTGSRQRERTAQMARLYFAAQDVHERLSSAHFDYAAFHQQWQHTDLPFRLERMIETQAQTCQDIAGFLHHGAALKVSTSRLQRDELRLQQSWQWFAAEGQEPFSAVPRVLQNLQEVNLQLAQFAVQPLKPPPESDIPTVIPAEQESLVAALSNLRQNLGLHSATFRHAIRLSVVVACSGLVVQLFHLELGYWILLTALFVCQPSYTATRSRVNQRVLGTLIGVVVGSVLPQVFVSYEAKLLVILFSTTLFFAFRSVRYSFSTAFITIEALTGLSLLGFDVYQALPMRMVDTLAGSLLAWLAVSLLWPDWKWLRVDEGAAAALNQMAGYLQAVTLQLRRGRTDDAPYRLARRRAYEGAAQLGSMVGEIAASAKHYGQQVPQGQGLLTLIYGLLGSIAVLGAARDNTIASDDVRLSPALLAMLEQVSDLMTRLPQLSTQAFETEVDKLGSQLSRLRPAEGSHLQDTVAWQQLSTMLTLLRPFYRLLHSGGAY